MERIAGCPLNGQLVDCLVVSYTAWIAAGIAFIAAFALVSLFFWLGSKQQPEPAE
jgi:hypothetical protein